MSRLEEEVSLGKGRPGPAGTDGGGGVSEAGGGEVRKGAKGRCRGAGCQLWPVLRTLGPALTREGSSRR